MAKQNTKSYKMDMCNGPILSKMLIFAIPLMFSSILQLLFNAADIIVVSRFAGDNSMAAVGSTSSLINLLVNLFVGLSVGANVLAARYFAAEQEDDLSQTVHTAIMISLVGGIVLAIGGSLGAHKILEWMESPPEVIDLASLYLRIFFLGMPANLIYNFGSALLRAIGDTKRPLYYLSFAGVVNVVLNLLFVIKFHMDVAGVAVATVVSQAISAVLIIRCLMRETGGIQFCFSKFRATPSKVMQISMIGLPAGFQGIIFSLSNVVIQSSINSFGNIVVSGSSAAANIEGFVYVAMNALYQATLSFCGQNSVTRNYARIKRITVIGVCCVLVVGLLLGGLATIFGRQLVDIYTDNPDVITEGFIRLSIIASTYAICGMMDVMCGAMRGIGYAVMPMIVSLAGVCGFRLMWLATIFTLPQFHTPAMIYISYPISWTATFLIHVGCFIFAMKKLERSSQS
ncbi:MAG: MATE family efflux transporter [Oscillospiraceae bacterium]|nr:MATE family efflux transporter [Oscillospiraceae bacterium]